jgi:TonB family protein
MRKVEQIELRALIEEDGSVREVTLRQSSGDSQLDKAARSLAEHLRFRPRKINNRFVRSLVDLVLSPAASTDPTLACTLRT